jgi:lipoate-protein ligase B
MTMPAVGTARLMDLGRRSYRETWELQHDLHRAIREQREPDTWIVVEHPPTITLGRQAKREHLLLSAHALAARGIDVVEIERGGDVTYHGPGQLVVYPIRRLERFREVVPLVRTLEGAVIEACDRFGVKAGRWAEHPGVWIGNDQICAIGLAVRAMVSLHGIAFNVSTDLTYDR